MMSISISSKFPNISPITPKNHWLNPFLILINLQIIPKGLIYGLLIIFFWYIVDPYLGGFLCCCLCTGCLLRSSQHISFGRLLCCSPIRNCGGLGDRSLLARASPPTLLFHYSQPSLSRFFGTNVRQAGFSGLDAHFVTHWTSFVIFAATRPAEFTDALKSVWFRV